MTSRELPGGFHSTISVAEGRVRKTYGDKVPLTPHSSDRLINHMKQFDQKARAIGVPTSEAVAFQIAKHKDNKDQVMLHELVEYAGPDIRFLLQEGKLKTADVFRLTGEVLALHKKVWDANWPISLDPPLANFCVADGQVIYIDKMPPRQRLTGGEIFVDYPDPLKSTEDFITKRYFSAYQVRVIYAQMLRDLKAYPEVVPYTKELIGLLLGQEAYTLVTIPPAEKERTLDDPKTEDVDILRIIAGEAVITGTMDEEVAKQVYHYTHIQPGGALPEKTTLHQAARLIRQPFYGYTEGHLLPNSSRSCAMTA